MSIFLHDALTGATFELEHACRLRVYEPPSDASLGQLRAHTVGAVLQRYLQLLGFELVVDPSALPAGVPEREYGLAIEGHWLATGSVLPTPVSQGEEVTRYALMNAPYREQLGAELPAMLEGAERALEYLYATRKRLADLPEARIIPVQTAPPLELSELRYALASALNDELDVPRALLALTPFLKSVNELCDGALRKQGRVNQSAVEAAEDGFATIKGLFGIGGEEPARFLRALRDVRARARQLDIGAIEAKLQARVHARAARDFVTADRLQAELLAQGVTLLDHANGTDWTIT
jgi:cysteinyl-tRNA synthetase